MGSWRNGFLTERFEEMVERAYDIQGDNIAFVQKDGENPAGNGKRRCMRLGRNQ